ncbi:MAG TPA: chemotaxis protein CheW [Opitutaceae bacterium]|nr:chemotaxis protein CheW [Opitutaceae bacterium]
MNSLATPAAGAVAVPGKYLTITLAREGYSIPVIKVREIIRYQKVTPVPQLPAHVKGVINLRGRIIPVLDLRVQFGLDAGHDDRTCIVVVTITLASSRGLQMGLIVDSVEEVSTVGARDIEPTPEFGHVVTTEYLLGVAKIRGEVKMLLNIDRLLEPSALSQIAAADAVPATTP